jgi:hypothetical protein
MNDKDLSPEQYLAHLHEKGELADFVRQAVQDGISCNVRKLSDGKQDREAALELLDDLRSYGATPKENPELFWWLYEAVEKILSGEDANAAFGLKRGRGQKRQTAKVCEIAIAMFVKLEIDEGLSPTRAKEVAAEHFSREIRSIENAVRDVELNPALSEGTMRRYIRENRKPQ